MIYNEIMKKSLISLMIVLVVLLVTISCHKESPSQPASVQTSDSSLEKSVSAETGTINTTTTEQNNVEEKTSVEIVSDNTENTAIDSSEKIETEKSEDSDVFVELSGEFGKLDVQDYYGNRVTAKIFTEYDVTMVNIFTTWCTWCIKELPDMVKLADNMPEGSKLISICADAFDAPDALKEIIEQYNVGFPVLKMAEKQVRDIHSIIGYPTTFYVGRNGEILDMSIGMPAEGVSGYRSKVEQLLAK